MRTICNATKGLGKKNIKTLILGSLATLGFSAHAYAQSTPKLVDENGIDLVTGQLALVEKDVHIGPDDGGLSVNRVVGDVDRIDHN